MAQEFRPAKLRTVDEMMLKSVQRSNDCSCQQFAKLNEHISQS